MNSICYIYKLHNNVINLIINANRVFNAGKCINTPQEMFPRVFLVSLNYLQEFFRHELNKLNPVLIEAEETVSVERERM